MTTIADSCNDLTIHHLSICTKDSTPEERLMRGVIKCGDTIVCKSFGHTPEVLHTDVEEIANTIQPLVDEKVRAFKSFEGSILRVWNYKGDWNISTHRRLDAFKSKWGTQKSYGDMFVDALRRTLNSTENSTEDNTKQDPLATQDDNKTFFAKYCQGLNPDYVYAFLMRNGKDNKLVCNVFDESVVFIVGALNRENDWSYIPGRNINECRVPSSVEVTYSSLQDCIDLVANLNVREYQGLIFISDDGKAVKLMNATYVRMLNLRDNVPNVLLRYIQLSINKDAVEDLKLFLTVYEEQAELFNQFTSVIADITKNIHRKYVQRYIQGKVAVIPGDQFNIMKALHQKHIDNRSFKVTEQSVKDYISVTIGASQQLRLFENYIKRKAELGNGNFVPENVRQKIYDQLHDWSQ